MTSLHAVKINKSISARVYSPIFFSLLNMCYVYLIYIKGPCLSFSLSSPLSLIYPRSPSLSYFHPSLALSLSLSLSLARSLIPLYLSLSVLACLRCYLDNKTIVKIFHLTIFKLMNSYTEKDTRQLKRRLLLRIIRKKYKSRFFQLSYNFRMFEKFYCIA